MKSITAIRGAAWSTLPALLITMSGSATLQASAASSTVQASIYSTMPSTTAHSPQMALDGNPSTYFKSVYDMGDGDTFLVVLSQPVPLRSLHIVTGGADGKDEVTNGVAETSPDGAVFRKAAAFGADGVADAKLGGQPIKSIRIHLNEGAHLPALLIREITIGSPVKISDVRLAPGRGFVDLSQAPDMEDWAKRAEIGMEDFWPKTAYMLRSDGFISPNMVNVVYKTGPDVTGVAATGGGVMTINTKWCREHDDDTGLAVHEMTHMIQATPYEPVWLVEGTADYIRWVKFEPQNFHPRINVKTAKYSDSYQTTATFLGWCENHYGDGLVTKLNDAVRYGKYSDDLFQKYCGKDVNALWAEFIAAYQADPSKILAKPAA
ncbi:hypothetical protein CCAX7_45930 [Capsulimonas corticalis]|uniref:F5/8 type C domain-containing protein n=1 Tax=Capsulimonas corticalis TaxID=2219043 RepID=A0A9N7L709_9BACT|nr:basic secretory protein-like protein [Capsulimonas corticalis]BDI32542.1 hypothetical protein CCAX7_45930 [Capsulimonas corticalis]